MTTQIANTTVLVTGGTGFLGAYCILHLVQAGYRGRTTVRPLKREDEVRAMLKAAGMEPGDKLSFVAADLLADQGWAEAFMNRHYRFNVSLARFGYLTGRSLSAFKRDFTRIFGLAPGRWLLAKRLEEAYFLLTKTDRNVSDVCFAVGFEDLSHFSFSFKARYQVAHTQLRKVLTKAIINNAPLKRIAALVAHIPCQNWGGVYVASLIKKEGLHRSVESFTAQHGPYSCKEAPTL